MIDRVTGKAGGETMQQNITHVVEGWSSSNGAYHRKESMAVQTLDGVIQALRYLATVQGYKCFTVSTQLVSIEEMLGTVEEIKEENLNGPPT